MSPVDEGELELPVGMSVLGDHDEEVRGGGGEEWMMRSPTAVILKLRQGVSGEHSTRSMDHCSGGLTHVAVVKRTDKHLRELLLRQL